jgi:hypothetical protein
MLDRSFHRVRFVFRMSSLCSDNDAGQATVDRVQDPPGKMVQLARALCPIALDLHRLTTSGMIVLCTLRSSAAPNRGRRRLEGDQAHWQDTHDPE